MPRPADVIAPLVRMGWFVGLVSLAALTFAHPSATRMHTMPWALVAALLWLFPIAVMFIVLLGAKTWRIPPKTIIAGLALMAIGAVVSAWISPFAQASLARVWPTLGGVMACLGLQHWLTSPTNGAARRDFVVLGLSLAGALFAVTSLAYWMAETDFAFRSMRNTVPFGHSNYTAGCLVLFLPWLVMQSWNTRRLTRAGWTLVTLVALIALVGTSSRGGILALTVVIGGTLVVAIATGHRTRKQKLIFAGIAFLAGATVIMTNSRLRDLVSGRGWSAPARESNLQRAAMLDAGFRLGQERPWLGWGPGAVPLAYPQIRRELAGGVENALQLHNTPIQLWATLGTAGLVAGLLLFSGAASATVSALRVSPRNIPALTAAASLWGYAIFALTDHQFDLPAVVAIVTANFGLLTSSVRHEEQNLSLVARVCVGAGLTVLAVGPLVSLGRDLNARRLYDSGLAALEAGRPEEFKAAMEAASRAAPYDPYFEHQIAGWHIEARDTARDPVERQKLTHQASLYLVTSLRTRVHEEYACFNLGWLLLDLGQPALAVHYFTDAARLVPDKGGVYFGLGLALQAAGRPQDAIRAFALEWINDPRSAFSPAWELESLAALRPAIRQETQLLYADLARRFPTAQRGEQWANWWSGQSVLLKNTGGGFTTEAMEFAAAQPLVATRSALTQTNARWARLYSAWREATPEAFAKLVPHDSDFSAALARRAVRHPQDFRTFLVAGTENEPTFLRTMHRERPGYGVLALHPEGPVLSDAFFVQENRVLADFASGLFPPKGWLPGRFLLALLPPEPR